MLLDGKAGRPEIYNRYGFLPDPEDAAHRDPPTIGAADSGGIPCGMWYCVCPECRDEWPALVEAWRDNMRRGGASDERIAAWVAETAP